MVFIPVARLVDRRIMDPVLFVIACFVHAVAGGVNVPTVSTCHKVIDAGNGPGQVKSHDQYPSDPYPTGYQCRFVINAPAGRTLEATLGVGEVGIRPWDFAIIVDGAVASQLKFMCEVVRLTPVSQKGNQKVLEQRPVESNVAAVVQKYFVTGLTRSIKSNTSTIVVDFCVHTFSKELENRKGFEIYYTSTPGPHKSTETPASNPDLSVPPSPPRLRCGNPQNPPSSNPNRIVNGVMARENSWPWICSLVQKPSLQFCGCTLIAEQWVVTAGHCVDNSGADHLKRNVLIYLGVENLRLAGAAHKYSIIDVVKHEKYNDPPGSTSNDIALLKLDRPVIISNDAMPACLPNKSVHEPPFVQSENFGRRVCWVAGWGRLYDGQSIADGGRIGAGSDNLRQVAIEVMSQNDCKTYMSGYTITEKMFCGGYDNGQYDSCQGDSGGPLVCDDGTGRWNLYGVVSWGLGCAQAKAPGIYTNVALMRDWLDSKLGLGQTP